MRRLVLILLVLIVIAAAGTYVVAGFQTPPSLAFTKPGEFPGAVIPIDFQTRSATPAGVQLAFEQNGTRTPLPAPPGGSTTVKMAASAASVPELKIQAG